MRTALASFPRSGNHWVRYMIEGATGQTSGTIYKVDGGMERGGDGIVIKTHDSLAKGFDRAIHLFRNPVDSIHSWRLWRIEGGIIDEDPQAVSSDAFFLDTMRRWEKHTLFWLNTGLPTYRVRYEDLQQDAPKYLTQMVAFLDQRCTAEQITGAIERAKIDKMRRDENLGNERQRNRHFRVGRVLNGYEGFTIKQIELLRDRLAYLLNDPRIALLDYVNQSIRAHIKAHH